jgi:acetylornithine/N-succinyldiaminopimelate aminotransferase
VARVFTPGTHGSTFGGNPLATAVGLTVFGTLIEDKLAERAGRMGKVLAQGLEAIRAKHPKAVKEIRGRGLLAGLDLVPPVADAVAACRERGLLVLTAGDNTLRLAPPLIVTDNEVAQACGIIDAALAGMAS